MTEPVPSIRLRLALGRVGLGLAAAYLLLAGAQYYGLVLFPVNVISIALLGVSLVAWVGWQIRRRRAPAATLLDPVIWAALLVGAVNAALSLDTGRSLGALWLGAVLACLFWMSADLLAAGLRRQTLARAMHLAGGVILLVALAQVISFWADWLLLGRLPAASFRVAAANPTAMIANFIWPLWAAEAITARRAVARAAWAGAVALTGVVLLYTSSRGGWLGTLAGAAVLALLYRGPLLELARRLLAIRWLAALSLLGIALAVAVAGAIAVRQWQHATHAPTLAAARSEFWPVALEVFRRAPLLGQGLFTYGSAYLGSLSVPPRGIFNQAHGLYHNLLAETGLAGVALFAWGLAVLVGQVRRAQAALGADPWRAAALAGLGAMLLHGVFETPYVNPPAMALAALAAALALPVTTGRTRLNVLLSVVVVAAGAWGVWAYAPLHQGVTLGDLGRWPEAARALDEAVRRDPLSTWARLQAAYAHQRAGQPALALPLYAEALRHEPGYALNRANAAAAYRAAGEAEESARLLAQAIALAPQADVLTRTQAAWSGQSARPLDPNGLEARLARVLGGRASPDELQADRDRLQAGQASAAEVIQLAGIEISLGRLEQAEALLRYAQALRSPEAAALQLARGDLAAARGDLGAAADQYARALPALYQPGVLGNATEYGWLIFGRESLSQNLAPELVNPPSAAWLERARTLAAWQRVLGETEAAQRLEEEIAAWTSP